jgi:hypothetical protein
MIVVPFGCRSIASTTSCLEVERVGTLVAVDFAVVEAPFFGFDLAGPLAETEPRARGSLRKVLADLDFDLLVAMWLFPV